METEVISLAILSVSALALFGCGSTASQRSESKSFQQSKASSRVYSSPTVNEAVAVLETFLGALAAGEVERAYKLVAPSSKKNGDPIAYRAKLDFESFIWELRGGILETGRDPDPKFFQYQFGESRWESENCFRIWIHFAGGDNDEAMILRESDTWYVADPVHIIR